MRLGILGGGRAAWAFGSTWRRIGWPIDGVWLRPESQSRLPELLEAPRKAIDALEADLLLLAVSDRAIDVVAGLIPSNKAILFHASGAMPAVRGGFSLHPHGWHRARDRKSTRLNSSHTVISYAVFCLKKKKKLKKIVNTYYATRGAHD